MRSSRSGVNEKLCMRRRRAVNAFMLPPVLRVARMHASRFRSFGASNRSILEQPCTAQSALSTALTTPSGVAQLPISTTLDNVPGLKFAVIALNIQPNPGLDQLFPGLLITFNLYIPPPVPLTTANPLKRPVVNFRPSLHMNVPRDDVLPSPLPALLSISA